MRESERRGYEQRRVRHALQPVPQPDGILVARHGEQRQRDGEDERGQAQQHLEDAERGAEEARLGLGRHERDEHDEHAEVDDAHGEGEGERERLPHEPPDRLAVRRRARVGRCARARTSVTGMSTSPTTTCTPKKASSPAPTRTSAATPASVSRLRSTSSAVSDAIRSSTQIGTVSIDWTLIRMIPIPPSAVPATTTPSYPAKAVKPIAPRTPIAAVASREHEQVVHHLPPLGGAARDARSRGCQRPSGPRR